MEQMIELFQGFVPIKTVGIDVLQPTFTTNLSSSWHKTVPVSSNINSFFAERLSDLRQSNDPSHKKP